MVSMRRDERKKESWNRENSNVCLEEICAELNIIVQQQRWRTNAARHTDPLVSQIVEDNGTNL